MDPTLASSWPGDVEVYPFDDLPTGRDMFLVGSDQLEDLRREWERYLAEPDGTTPDHPNEFLNIRWCAAERVVGDGCDLNVCITMSTRYHGAVHKLPRSKFVACVLFWNYQKRPYLVVAQEWFDEIARQQHSLYALVDVVGMRSLLARQGRVEPEQVSRLRSGIDDLAAAHPDHAFLSFADNVLVKTNWSPAEKEYERSYRPEDFLGLVQRVRGVFRAALGLDAYAVLTQGSNQFVDDALLRISPGKNHIFFGSLGSPFAELFDIDHAVRDSIRSKVHPPKELYLSKTLAVTLHYKHYEVKDQVRGELVPFSSKTTSPEGCAYLPINAEDLFRLLRPAQLKIDPTGPSSPGGDVHDLKRPDDPPE